VINSASLSHQKTTAAKYGLIKRNKWLLLRRLSQFSILGLYLLGVWAEIWIIKGNLSSSLVLDTVPLTDPLLVIQMFAAGVTTPLSTVLIGALLVSIFYLLLGGRVFCSWVCPVNIITDAANYLRNHLRIKLNSRLNKNTRYWLLAMTVILSFFTSILAYEFINPVSIIHRSLIFGMGFASLMIVAIFLFDLLIINRGWCSHLCPMGAFYSLLGKFSPVRVHATQRQSCKKGCNDCFYVCPEPQVITPALKGANKGHSPIITSGNCTNCGRCIDVCPEAVFQFGLYKPAFSIATHSITFPESEKQKENS
jgi:ferredoxin-type protein NapH